MPNHRKPLSLHVVQGTFRAHRHANRSDPETRAEVSAKPPRHLSADARRTWRELLARAPEGVLRDADDVAVELAAAALAAYRTVLHAATTTPLTENTPNGTRMHPLHTELRRQASALHVLLGALGFRPDARARLTVDDPHDDRELREFGASLRGTKP